MAGFEQSLDDPQLWLPNSESVSAGGGLYTTQGLTSTAPGLYAFNVIEPIVVTGFVDVLGPRIKIEINGVPAGYTLTLYRIYGNIESIVRDAERAFAGGGYTETDYEAPVGVPVTYRAELFDEFGVSQGFTPSATTTLVGPVGVAWFSDPLDPANVVGVDMHGRFGSRLVRTRNTNDYQIGDRVVSLLGARGLLRGIPLWVHTDTIEQADALERVLAATNVLVRTMPIVRIPRALYVSVSAPEEVPQNVARGGEWIIWELVGNEISSPNLDIVVPVVTWQTYMDTFPTWNDFNAAYLTWNDAIRNPPEA